MRSTRPNSSSFADGARLTDALPRDATPTAFVLLHDARKPAAQPLKRIDLTRREVGDLAARLLDGHPVDFLDQLGDLRLHRLRLWIRLNTRLARHEDGLHERND